MTRILRDLLSIVGMAAVALGLATVHPGAGIAAAGALLLWTLHGGIET